MSKTKKPTVEHEIVTKKNFGFPIIMAVLFFGLFPLSALFVASLINFSSLSSEIILQTMAVAIPGSVYLLNRLYEPTEYEEVVHVIKK